MTGRHVRSCESKSTTAEMKLELGTRADTVCNATDGSGRPNNNAQSLSILFCPIVF